jgi:hypothetical protein
MPDIDSIRNPNEIILEQGYHLVEMIGGLLNYVIERIQKNALLTYEFIIGDPALQYRQPLLRITHDIKLFPAILCLEQSGAEYISNNQKEFEDDLGVILPSEETRTSISGLVAQAHLVAQIEK